MKSLSLKSQHYQALQDDFRDWLQALGYASTTTESLPIYIRELFFYLEQNGILHIRQATETDIETFFFQWKKRKNLTTGAGLSNSHINKGLLSINKFTRFLKETGTHYLAPELKREANHYKAIQVLTKEEIRALYEATFIETGRYSSFAYNQRDRAILGIFYGCGLRLKEGINLDKEDILLDKKLVFVRKGKGNKERYVPITDKNLEDLAEYLFYGRKWFLETRKKPNPTSTKAFFVNVFGNRMGDTGFYTRLKQLHQQCDGELRDNQISLHTLRHSIATHLLQSGMSIENISRFLGHSTIDSTQIYTHILNEL